MAFKRNTTLRRIIQGCESTLLEFLSRDEPDTFAIEASRGKWGVIACYEVQTVLVVTLGRSLSHRR